MGCIGPNPCCDLARFCPASGQNECSTHSGSDTCCDRPDQHRAFAVGAAPAWAATYAVGGDQEPEVEAVKPVVVRRRTLPAAPVARRTRQR